MSPVPIVVCGRTSNIAKSVREGLLPDYDVVHIVLGVEQGVSDIPLLLSNKTPPNASGNLGSQSYAERPAAVAIGGGYNDDHFAQMKDACGDEKVIWLRTDTTKISEMPDFNDAEAYGKATAGRVRKKLEELKVGKEDGKVEGVYWF